MAREEKSLVLGAELGGVADDASAATPRRARRKEHGASWIFLLRGGSILAMIAIWWSLTFFFPPSLIPLPSATFSEVISIVSTGQFFSEMGATFVVSVSVSASRC